MFEMIVALLLVAVFVIIIFFTTKGADKSLCNGNCYQGRRCNCKDKI
jgi:regulatory protein YycI of two-component signal transduction system YycFG